MAESVLMESHPQRSLRGFFRVLFRHKGKVILFFMGVMIIVAGASFLTQELYRPEARLMVRIGRESVSLPPTATTGQVISVG
jgi:uncharacterized protein involved in exopolysaccharide biosynthesis